MRQHTTVESNRRRPNLKKRNCQSIDLCNLFQEWLNKQHQAFHRSAYFISLPIYFPLKQPCFTHCRKKASLLCLVALGRKRGLFKQQKEYKYHMRRNHGEQKSFYSVGIFYFFLNLLGGGRK